MRIWIVTSIRLLEGGRLRASSIQNLLTAAALADAGHSVLLWTAPMPPADRAALWEILGRDCPPGLRLLPAVRRGAPGEKKSPFATPRQRLAARIRTACLAGHRRPDAIVCRSPRILSQLREMGMGARLVLEYQYPEYMLLWRDWRRRQAAAPPLGEARAKLRACFEKEKAWVLGSCDAVACAAPAHGRLLERIGYRGASEPLPSGCRTPEEDLPVEQPEYSVGYVGSLAPENGVDVLLRAFAALPDDAGRLLIIGRSDGADGERLRALLGRLGLENRVDMPGELPHYATRVSMRRCAVGVAPFRADCGPEKRQYASPLKVIEWMAAGRCVAAADVASVRDSFEEGRELLLFPPGDSRALGQVLQDLLADEPLRRRLAMQGLDLARTRSFDQRAERLARLCCPNSGAVAGPTAP